MSGETDKEKQGGAGGAGGGDDAAAKAAADAKAKTDADAKAAAEAAEKNRTVPHQAFHEERELRKEAEKKLKEYQDAEAERKRKADEEQGNFKGLYEGTQAQIKTLSEENAAYKTRIEAYEKGVQERIDKSLESVKSDEDKEMVKSLLAGKSAEEKDKLLPKLIEKFGIPSNINAGARGAGSGGQGSSGNKETEREEAKKNGNVRSLIKNAPQLAKQ